MVQGSPAGVAKLRSGDIITLLAGKNVASVASFNDIVARLPAGKMVPLRIVRGGRAGFVAVQAP